MFLFCWFGWSFKKCFDSILENNDSTKTMGKQTALTVFDCSLCLRMLVFKFSLSACPFPIKIITVDVGPILHQLACTQNTRWKIVNHGDKLSYKNWFAKDCFASSKWWTNLLAVFSCWDATGDVSRESSRDRTEKHLFLDRWERFAYGDRGLEFWAVKLLRQPKLISQLSWKKEDHFQMKVGKVFCWKNAGMDPGNP